ncbi:hypothetical protein H632_c235p0 [Helicosporidium sp. ATCC 50920]|nr:hypothetical protein H632_c235p0 [Helicosporidium sp. ATCC 50920]|eukprot:KDD76409.1 hypothetical protein H632_c235p0 [Helicosporidium sp. ATCC 50920]
MFGDALECGEVAWWGNSTGKPLKLVPHFGGDPEEFLSSARLGGMSAMSSPSRAHISMSRITLVALFVAVSVTGYVAAQTTEVRRSDGFASGSVGLRC